MGVPYAAPAGAVLTVPPPQTGVRSCLVAADIGRAARLRPGEMVRFRRVQSPLA
jgi:hypothetical protein